jgi:hypothetical protein
MLTQQDLIGGGLIIFGCCINEINMKALFLRFLSLTSSKAIASIDDKE